MQANVLFESGFVLGEGLHWDVQRQCLWGVDIHGRTVWRWHEATGQVERWALDQRVGWVLPSGKADLLLGLQAGVALAPANAPSQYSMVVQPFAHNPGLRLNDAKADSTGAVWCGSLNNDDESQPLGALFRLGPDGNWQTMDSGYQVANGPALSEAHGVMLHTDSARQTIYRFDLDVDAGAIANKRVWRTFSAAEGYPDGMCFDADGALWVAHWGGACISRCALNGTLLARVPLPTSHVTNVCFGGAALDRLFVTTAKAGLSPEQLGKEPLAGHVFEVLGHGTQGLAAPQAALSHRH
jgi:D-xylonolactonase